MTTWTSYSSALLLIQHKLQFIQNAVCVFVLDGQIKVHLSITNLRKAKFDINNVLGNKDK